MMKKLLPFLCASALALSLTACAGTINNSTADTASNVTFTFTGQRRDRLRARRTTGYEIDGTALTITDERYLHRLRQLRGRLHQGEKGYDRRDAGAGRPDTYE